MHTILSHSESWPTDDLSLISGDLTVVVVADSSSATMEKLKLDLARWSNNDRLLLHRGVLEGSADPAPVEPNTESATNSNKRRRADSVEASGMTAAERQAAAAAAESDRIEKLEADINKKVAEMTEKINSCTPAANVSGKHIRDLMYVVSWPRLLRLADFALSCSITGFLPNTTGYRTGARAISRRSLWCSCLCAGTSLPRHVLYPQAWRVEPSHQKG